MNPLWAISFANLSSYSEFCACLSFRVSFGTQMVLWLMRSHLLICGLFFIILRGGYMKNLLHFMSRQWHPTPVLLPGKSYGWRSLEGCSPWGRWGSDMTERLRFHFSLSCIREGNGSPLQCSRLENPRDGGAWWAAICGVTQSRTRLKRRSSSSSVLFIFLKILYMN